MAELAWTTLSNKVPQSIDQLYVFDCFESSLHVPRQWHRSVYFANVIIHLSSPYATRLLFFSQEQKNKTEIKNKQTAKKNNNYKLLHGSLKHFQSIRRGVHLKGPFQWVSSMNTSIASDNREGMLWRELDHVGNYIKYELQLALNQSHSARRFPYL